MGEQDHPKIKRGLLGLNRDDIEEQVRSLEQQAALARARADSEATRAAAAEQRVNELQAEVAELERRSGSPAYARLGERIQSMLTLADEAAGELRERAREEAADQRRRAEQEASAVIEEAQREADRMLTRARQMADSILGDGERRLADLRADLARVERQRDAVLDALSSLRERLGEATGGLGSASTSKVSTPAPPARAPAEPAEKPADDLAVASAEPTEG